MPDQRSRADKRPLRADADKTKEPGPPGPPFGLFPFWPFPLFGLAVPLWCSLFVFPLLDWQRVMLKAWQKALADPELGKMSRDEASQRMKLILGLYVAGHRSSEEVAKDLAALQSDWVEAGLKTVEAVLGRRT